MKGRNIGTSGRRRDEDESHRIKNQPIREQNQLLGVLTKLAGTHVLQDDVRLHLVVTRRTDGGVTCGRQEVRGQSTDQSERSRPAAEAR